jgi:hypothetical protein
MSEYEPWEMKLAWQEIWQLRGCPPDAVLRGPLPGPELRRHLEICPFCPERFEDPTTGMSRTRSGQVPPHLHPVHGSEPSRDPASPSFPATTRSSKPAARDRPPRPGQLRSIRHSLGGWGPRGRHYNPPLVLVTSIPEAPPDAVRVAQVHNQEILAGPADVPLGHGLFAEAWNSYALRRDDLGEVWEEVPEATLGAVLERARWGLPPAPDEDAPWIEAFQRLEMEVGAFFALQAVDALLREGDESPLDRVLAEIPDVAALAAHLGRCRSRAILPEGASGVLEAMALARFPDHELPLAASGPENRIILNRVSRTGEGIELSPLTAELTHWECGPGGLTSGGVIEAASPEGSELRAWLDIEEGAPLAASDVSFAPARGIFRARFPGVAMEMARRGRLILLLCHPAGGGSPVAGGE